MTIKINFSSPFTTKPENQILLLHKIPWLVVSGTAKGADTWGEVWASMNKIAIKRYPAQWDVYGKGAGPIRNALMADNADGLVAVWDGESHGTKNMIETAEKRGLRVFVHLV